MIAKPPAPRPPAEQKPQGSAWRSRWHEVIFEADTPAGKRFDLALLGLILLSVLAVCLESVRELREAHGSILRALEWVITVLFTAEYFARLAAVQRPLRYMVSFFGLVDLLAILPTYLSFLLPGS
ncbi:MAG TPA: ion transporter, partial [Opitutus sp.]|nr:ion transporter [Opitutus sp.]